MITFMGIMSTFLLLPSGVTAQTSNLLPDQIEEIFDLFGEDGSGTASFISGRVRTGIYIALGMIILVAVIYALIAAFKYIQSQGDPGKIEEAQKAIKAIFMGIAAMLIGIVGVVLVFVFFGAGRVDPNLTQVCISAPNSNGCEKCKEDVEDKDCVNCDDWYAAFAAGTKTEADIPADCKDPLNQGSPIGSPSGVPDFVP
jgi:hypothetical protein